MKSTQFAIGAVVFFVSVLLSSGSIAAGAGTRGLPDINPSPSGSRTLQEAMDKAGITKYLTPENGIVTDRLAQTTDSIIKELGEYYAGTWLEYDENHKAYQVVATTNPITNSRTLQNNPEIIVVLVKYSKKQLRDLYHDLFYTFIIYPGGDIDITSGNVDYMKNLVAVRVNTGDIEKVSSALRKAGYNMDMMYFEEASRPVPVPATAIP